MAAKVLAIWLDAAEPVLLERLMARGELPNLARLKAEGAYGRLRSIEHTLSETVCGMVLTGQPPEKTGTWNVGTINTRTYQESRNGRTKYNDLPTFLQFDPRLRTCIFDIPGLPLLPSLNGIQVASWGAHSPKIKPSSHPTGLLEELTQRHGEHPAGGYSDHACLEDPEAMRDLKARLLAGLPRRGAIACDLLGREDWDLFFMCFGEPHGAGHAFWPHPECLELLDASGTRDAIEVVYRAIDHELGRIVAAAGGRAKVIIFSTEGMTSDNFDVPNMVFLPELLFRYSFRGAKGLDFDPRHGPSPEALAGIKNWVMEVWHQRRRPNRVEHWLQERASLPLAMKLYRGLGLQPPLFHPSRQTFWNFQPTTWAVPYRPYMKAFALITASDGFIRLNVKGREKRGVIAARDYRRTCDEIVSLLEEWKDPASGKPAVRKVLTLRDDPFAWGGTDHDADLIVLWNPEAGTRLTGSRFGEFGPVPYHRTSAHTPDGFLVAKGPGVAAGVPLPTGSPLDIAPTVLQLAGARTLSLPGRCLISPSMLHAAA